MQGILQIRQTPAVIGIDADMGQYSISQPKAELSITTTPGELNVESSAPELTINQKRARAAYNGGTVLEMNSRIYSGIEQLYLQAIAKRMEQGTRMAEFYKPGNTIAEIYGTDTEPNSFPNPCGPASFDNVDLHYESRAPRISYRAAQVNIQVNQHAPEIEYTRGKLDIYVQQYASVQFIPPEINTQI